MQDILKKTAKEFQGLSLSSVGPNTECDVIPHLNSYVLSMARAANPLELLGTVMKW